METPELPEAMGPKRIAFVRDGETQELPGAAVWPGVPVLGGSAFALSPLRSRGPSRLCRFRRCPFALIPFAFGVLEAFGKAIKWVGAR